MPVPDLPESLKIETRAVLKRAREASWAMAQAPGNLKNRWLLLLAEKLVTQREAILSANQLDLQNAVQAGRSGAMVERLRLDDRGIQSLVTALHEIAAMADPVGRLVSGEVRPQGFEVRKQRIPLGVIGMVYESRPNVTVDAAALCLKAGNAVVLRGWHDKTGVHHAQWCKNFLLQKRPQGLTADDLDQAPQHIGGAAVRPHAAGLELQRDGGQGL